MAQRITRLTTDQKIAGSNPAEVDKIPFFPHCPKLNQGCVIKEDAPPGGLEPPTFRLTAERASRLRHGGLVLAAVQSSDLQCSSIGDEVKSIKLVAAH